jgi:hypothetical protein
MLGYRRIICAFTLGLISVIAVMAQNGWIEVTPAGSGLSIKMPAQPKETIQEAGEGLVMHQYAAEQAGAVYLIGFMDLPQQASSEVLDKQTIKSLFDSGREQGLKDSQSTLVSESDITLGAFPGRAIISRSADGITLQSRLYLVKSRLIIIAVSMPKDQDDKAAAAEFFNSFKLARAQNN